jgi:F-type H+-transporting ATPase subunit b
MSEVQTKATTEEVQVPSHGDDSVVGKLLSPDPGVMLWVWVIFAVLLVVLRKFAWKPIISGIDAREKAMKDSLARAEEVSKKSEAAEDEQRKILEATKGEAAKLLAESREYAKDLKSKAEADAKLQAERIVAQARQEIEAAQQKAQAQLRQDAALLSIGVAEKILRKKVDAAEDKAFAERMAEEAPRP